MRAFRDLSIKRKLMLIIMLTSTFALLLTCTAFVIYELITFRQEMVKDALILAEVIGANSTAALVFDDRTSAEETLTGLTADQHILSACIYNLEGEVFAKYLRANVEENFPLEPVEEGLSFDDNHLALFRPIVLDGKKVGTVYIQYDLHEMYVRMKQFLGIGSIVMLMSILLAFLLSSKLQRAISEPILHLVQKARAVSERKDYSIRAVKLSQDELGLLIDTFNDMLVQIQERDTALHSAYNKVEKKVEERTKELQQEITERKAVEETLRESELRYHTLVETASDAIITIDEESTILFVNRTAENIFGYSIAEMLGQQLTMLMPKSLRDVHLAAVKRYVETGKKHLAWEAVEVPGLHKNGKEILLEISFGEVIKTGKHIFMGIVRNITERKQAQEALRKLSSAVEQTADHVIITNKNGIIEYVNPAFEKLTGYTKEEVIGKTPRILKSGKHDRRFYEELWETILSGRVFRDVSINKKKGGELYYEEKTITPLRNSQGNITHFVSTGKDITERKRAAEELTKVNRHLHAILSSTKEAIFTIDNDRIIKSCNRAAQQMFRYPETEIVGQKTAKFYPSEEAYKNFGERLNLALEEKGYFAGEFELQRANGEIFPVEFMVSILRSGEEHLGLVSLLRDITERRQAEEARAKMEVQLRQSQKMEAIGTLAGGIAHDFNNILTPILGYTDMVIDDVPENSQIRADLENVIKAANRAKDLVQQILTFSRQVEQEHKPVRIHLIVKEALKLLRASLPATIEIRQNLDTGCGAVLADPTQIHQVLINLCTNAYHAMRESGGVMEVSLGMVEVTVELAMNHSNLHEGTYVRLTVSDTGHGMDRRTMERVFEPFFTTKNVGEGTGLGLSVVHGIVVSHGGEITVESELGKGTRFHVYLPRTESDVEQETQTDEPIPKGKERILFVDDEEEIARMGKRMLERLGYDVTMRTSSVEALEAFRAQPDRFDLVITDQTMPNMIGLELAEKLLHYRPDVPIILITGFSEIVTPEIIKKIGICEYIMKPIVALDLGKAIRRALNPKNEKET